MEIALNRTFAALSDPTRRAILSTLLKGPAKVTQLAKPFKVSLPAISKHIRYLEKAGLLNRTKNGREHWCQLNPGPMDEALGWLNNQKQFWENTLDSLEQFLEIQKKEKKNE
ncbi:MAG: transcriptional regulator [Planctomycetota bacterium]|nr:MAG: transcriptional regulator [Planctomycetota bacterium]